MPEENASPPDFEAGLAELERVVKELEKGDLPLERSITLFETGMRLSADCKRQLEEAETRVEVLIKRGQDVVACPQPGKTCQMIKAAKKGLKEYLADQVHIIVRAR